MSQMISFADFEKVDLRVGKVIEAEKVPETTKLIAMKIDIGNETRQVVAGMADYLDADYFIGKQVVVVTNLAPRTLRGRISHGMILAADVGGRPYLITVDGDVPPGSKVR
jgi:methionine--tRNA ligase beta chain